MSEHPSRSSAPAPHRRLNRAAALRRRRLIRRRRITGALAAVLLVLLLLFGLSRLFHRPKATAAEPKAVPASAALSSASLSPADGSLEQTNGLTAEQAAAMLADPLMVLVNHTHAMPENYTFSTGKCGSAASVNNTLQSAACEAFLKMQTAAAKDKVTVLMQSGYRSVEYQSQLYEKKTQYYLNQGKDEETARKLAANVVNPPRYSEHNCGLAADLNSPEYTGLDVGFEKTAAFRWLRENAVDYGFILRYPKEDEALTEITYEPWHWRYVGVENARKIVDSGLCFEAYIEMLEKAASAAA